MKTNVKKVSDLDDRAHALQQGASKFEHQTGKPERNYCSRNVVIMIILGIIGLVIVAIIACEYTFY